MFCPKCGAVLFPKTDKGKKVFKCSCGYSNRNMEAPQFRESLEKKEEVPIIDNEIEPYPLTEAKCPKCGHDKAYFWTVQTRASDEPETKFFKCEKCKNIWRDYS